MSIKTKTNAMMYILERYNILRDVTNNVKFLFDNL